MTSYVLWLQIAVELGLLFYIRNMALQNCRSYSYTTFGQKTSAWLVKFHTIFKILFYREYMVSRMSVLMQQL